MKRIIASLLLIAVSLSAFAQGAAGLTRGERPLSDENAKVVTGEWRFRNEPITIARQIYDTFGYTDWHNDGSVTFDVRGWDAFAGSLGVRDQDNVEQNTTGEFIFELNGEQVLKQRVRYGERTIPVTIPLKDARSLTIITSIRGLVIAEPKLFKGTTPPAQPVTVGKTTTMTITGAPATFAVDPKDLDALANQLRTTVDAEPRLSQRVANGQVALMSFTLVDIPSASVAANVAEDLSTALIKKRFQLVERGQLDKVLKELKVQDSGMIDPKTAQQLGQLTGCDLVLVGSISDRGQFVVINSRLLETATGKAVAAERVEMRKIEIKR